MLIMPNYWGQIFIETISMFRQNTETKILISHNRTNRGYIEHKMDRQGTEGHAITNKTISVSCVERQLHDALLWNPVMPIVTRIARWGAEMRTNRVANMYILHFTGIL